MVQPSSPAALVGVGAGLVGLGVGCFGQVTTVAVQDSVPARLVGTATSTVALVRELGVTVGAATLGALLASRLLRALGPLQSLARLSPERLHALPAGTRLAYAEAYLSAFTPLMAALAVLFVAALAVSFLLPDRPLGQDVASRLPERGAGDALDAAEVFAVGEADARHHRAP
jgi:hypothetical protein